MHFQMSRSVPRRAPLPLAVAVHPAYQTFRIVFQRTLWHARVVCPFQIVADFLKVAIGRPVRASFAMSPAAISAGDNLVLLRCGNRWLLRQIGGCAFTSSAWDQTPGHHREEAPLPALRRRTQEARSFFEIVSFLMRSNEPDAWNLTPCLEVKGLPCRLGNNVTA